MKSGCVTIVVAFFAILGAILGATWLVNKVIFWMLTQ